MADASSNQSNFQLQQVIPDKVRIPTLADAGSILARTKASLFPATNQSQVIPPGSQGSPFIFRISNARDYLDLRSCVMDFSALIHAPALVATLAPPAGYGRSIAQKVAFDESALAWINRIRILVAGVLVEDIMDVNILSQIKKFYQNGPQQSNCIDDSLGSYKFDGTPASYPRSGGQMDYNVPGCEFGGGGISSTSELDHLDARAAAFDGTINVRNRGARVLLEDGQAGDGYTNFMVDAGNAVFQGSCDHIRRHAVPLRLISNFFNSKQWFYLRNASIQVEVYCETPAECLVLLNDTQSAFPPTGGAPSTYFNAGGLYGPNTQNAPLAGWAGGATNLPWLRGPVPQSTYYAINDLTIRADTYTMDNEIVGMIDNIIASQGLVYGYETTSTIQSSFSSTSPAIPFTRAVSDATQFTFVAQPQAWSNDLRYFGLTGWALPGLDNVQIQVGSTPFPIVPMNASMTRYVAHQAFNGDPADSLSTKQIPTRLEIANATNTADMVYILSSLTAVVNDSDMVCQPIAYPLRRTNTEGIYFINAGYNTGLDSGSMVLRFNWSAPTGTTDYWPNGPGTTMNGYLFLQYVRLLSMSGGRVSVSS